MIKTEDTQRCDLNDLNPRNQTSKHACAYNHHTVFVDVRVLWLAKVTFRHVCCVDTFACVACACMSHRHTHTSHCVMHARNQTSKHACAYNHHTAFVVASVLWLAKVTFQHVCCVVSCACVACACMSRRHTHASHCVMHARNQTSKPSRAFRPFAFFPAVRIVQKHFCRVSRDCRSLCSHSDISLKLRFVFL